MGGPANDVQASAGVGQVLSLLQDLVQALVRRAALGPGRAHLGLAAITQSPHSQSVKKDEWAGRQAGGKTDTQTGGAMRCVAKDLRYAMHFII